MCIYYLSNFCNTFENHAMSIIIYNTHTYIYMYTYTLPV